MQPALYYASWTSQTLTATVARTMLELPVATNRGLVLQELVLGFDATAAGSVKIEFGTFTTTGTGTALTVQKWLGDRTVDSGLSSPKVADTVEPTGFSQGTLGGTLYPALIVPLPSWMPFQWPLDAEFVVPESTNFAIRLTSTVTCACMGWARWGE